VADDLVPVFRAASSGLAGEAPAEQKPRLGRSLALQ
jgi:hypothetical protein